MALLFSEVTASANGVAETFLIAGIPRAYDDFEGWRFFDDFLREIDYDTEIHIHANAYRYGAGETVKATPEEAACMMMRQERNPSFSRFVATILNP